MSPSEGIVIVGAGPAGLAAAVQCKRLGHTPLLLDRTGRVGGLVANAFLVENYPGVEPTDGPGFVKLLKRHLNSFGLEVEKGTVEQLTQTGDGFIANCDLGEIRAFAVIVAVGTTPNLLLVPGAKEAIGYGLHYDVVTVSPRAKNSLVIGGGEAALDYALSLSRRGSKVTIMVRTGSLRARGRLVSNVKKNPLISISYNSEVNSVHKGPEGLTARISAPGGESTESADAIVVAIGRNQRALEILKGLDEGLPGTVSTRVPGLFVAGDARTGTLGQVGMAVGDGLDAAMAAVRFIS